MEIHYEIQEEVVKWVQNEFNKQKTKIIVAKIN